MNSQSKIEFSPLTATLPIEDRKKLQKIFEGLLSFPSKEVCDCICSFIWEIEKRPSAELRSFHPFLLDLFKETAEEAFGDDWPEFVLNIINSRGVRTLPAGYM